MSDRNSRVRWQMYILVISLCIFCVLMIGIRQKGKEKLTATGGQALSEQTAESNVGETTSQTMDSDQIMDSEKTFTSAGSGEPEEPVDSNGKTEAGHNNNERAVRRGIYVMEIPGITVSAEKNRKILLVNKSHPVPEDYQVEMVMVEDGYQVAKQIRRGLERMLADGRQQVPAGGFMIVSAYRSRELQEELLREEIQKNIWQGMTKRTAEWDALRTVAPAGCSEHQTGLAVDIVSENDPELKESQENTPENQWLRANCWKYGFILRYPKEKESVTGFAYEPWHFRYVGTYAAEQIMRQGLTLEEYMTEDGWID